MLRRLFRKAVQQGRSKRRGEAYSLPYVEPLSVARTPLADFINSLLGNLSIDHNRDLSGSRFHRLADPLKIAAFRHGFAGLG